MKKYIYVLLFALYYFAGHNLQAQVNSDSLDLSRVEASLSDDIVVLFSEKGMVNDSIPVYMFFAKYDIGDIRIAISLDGYFYEGNNLWEIQVENFPERIYIEDNALVVLFDDNRRITDWKRKLTFRPILAQDDIRWKLEKDQVGKSSKENEFDVIIEKTVDDFGVLFLNEMDFDDTSSSFTLATLKSSINLDYNNEELYAFLEKIDDSKTIFIKNKIYNLSAITYEKIFDEGKKITVSEGVLYLKGFKKIKFVFEEGAYITNTADFSDVITFNNCTDIEVHNLHVFHNVEGDCHAPVIGIQFCNKMLFKNCLIDGSGLVGFDVHKSKRIKILQSTITNCSKMALDSRLSSIVLDHVKITNNEMRNVFYADKSKIIIKNTVIKDNALVFFSWFDAKSSIKIKNSHIILNSDIDEMVYRTGDSPRKGTPPKFINTIIEHAK